MLPWELSLNARMSDSRGTKTVVKEMVVSTGGKNSRGKTAKDKGSAVKRRTGKTLGQSRLVKMPVTSPHPLFSKFATHWLSDRDVKEGSSLKVFWCSVQSIISVFQVKPKRVEVGHWHCTKQTTPNQAYLGVARVLVALLEQLEPATGVPRPTFVLPQIDVFTLLYGCC